ncbi:MAG: class I SAM-dependent methyltransferase [Methylococcaceae bacterium]|nr:class I SAM-dependent methyltransferase [Methylococcaceae bacterium]
MPDSGELSCLLCGMRAVGEVLSESVRDDRTGRHQVMRCNVCGHIQLFPLPDEEADRSFYDGDRQARNLIPDFDFEVWRLKCQEDTGRRLGWLEQVRPAPARVLDIGSGYGFFVDAAASAGYEAAGLDLSAERVALARANLRGEFLCGLVDETFVEGRRGRFDAVTLFHVLEHVPEPVAFLNRCKALLNPGGRLLIEVPNAADALLWECTPYRDFYWQRAHLSYFDSARLELALRRAGCGTVKVEGVQRYGLRNLLNWVDSGRPQLEAPADKAPSPLLAEIDALYRRYREQTSRSDTLIVEMPL